MMIGNMVASKVRNGISDIPVAPNATIVRNGPSFTDKTETAPTSVESPNLAASVA